MGLCLYLVVLVNCGRLLNINIFIHVLNQDLVQSVGAEMMDLKVVLRSAKSKKNN